MVVLLVEAPVRPSIIQEEVPDEDVHVGELPVVLKSPLKYVSDRGALLVLLVDKEEVVLTDTALHRQ